MNKHLNLVNGIKLTLDELAAPDPKNTPYVITLLREKLLNPEDVPEELLSLKDPRGGTSVLNMCIERFKEPISDDDGQTVPRALSLASKPGCKLPLHFRYVKEILEIAREDGWSVAHEAAYQGSLPESMMTEDILKLTTRVGCSVAYHVARRKNLPEWAKRQKDILLLSNGYGDYVAHMLAKHGDLSTEMMTEEILKLINRGKCSVAYYAANRKFLPDWAKRRKDILLLGNGQGDYVAHALAWHGELPIEMMTEDILKLINRDKCYVACYVALHNTLPDWAKRRKDILLLGNGRGDLVAHVLAMDGELPLEMMTPDILRLQNSVKQTVLSVIVFERHLSPEILMLPWDENTRVFEYLLSEQTYKNKTLQNKENLSYVKEQIRKFVQKKIFAELSVAQIQKHDYEGMER